LAEETTFAQESAAAAALGQGAEGPETLKDAEERLKRLDKELMEERQYSSTLELMRSRAHEQLSSKKSLIDKLHDDISAPVHDLHLLQKQTEDVQKQHETLNEYLKAYKKMNALETRSHFIQTKQRAKSREGDRHDDAKSRTSPGGNGANISKEKEGGSAKTEVRAYKAGGEDSVSLAEAEEAVKKIYVITGEHDAGGVIAKWEQRGANMSVWQGLAEETESHWEHLLKEKELLLKQVQQKFAFASSSVLQDPNSSLSSPSSSSATPDVQAIAESNIKMVSDALNKRSSTAEAMSQALARHEGVLDDMKHGLAFLMVKSNTLLADPKIGSKMVKENTTSFSKLFGDTIAKGMSKDDEKKTTEDFNPKQYEGLLPKELLNLPNTVRALERTLVATLGVVETESPAIFERMQPRAKVVLTVENIMRTAATARPMEPAELLPMQEVGLDRLARASATMENNLRVRIAEDKIADEDLLADIALEEDDDGADDDDAEGMGQTFMQKRSLFKESSERRVRAEQRKVKITTPIIQD